MRFYIVDAFSEEIFGGNTAGVVIVDNDADFPLEKIMIKTASELRYSETAFVKKLSEKRFVARYFTPNDEVDLCGHATIGLIGALMAEGAMIEGETCTLETKAGDLEIKTKEGYVFMEMASPLIVKKAIDLDILSKAMGVEKDDFYMDPTIISTGLPDVIVGIKSKETLLNMKPDFKLMSSYTDKLGVTGIHAFSLSKNKQTMAYCRNFAPLFGIDEEAATGTANGALTYYLYLKEIVETGKINVFVQGESMGRPSKIYSQIHEGNNHKIYIGGNFCIVAKGEINI